MSAALSHSNSVGLQGGRQSDSFSAHLALAAGVSVSIHAASLPELQAVVAKLQPAANDAKASTPAAAPPPAGNASASTAAQDNAQGAASGSASTGDAPRPTYDDVKARVLKLAKISRETATAALAKFGVDHGNKLKLEQYPEFLTHADAILAKGGAGA